jgi:hypothetical protein
VIDPTGCGDAYRSGLLYGIANGWDWVKDRTLAAVMGAIKIAHRGGQNHGPPKAQATRVSGTRLRSSRRVGITGGLLDASKPPKYQTACTCGKAKSWRRSTPV